MRSHFLRFFFINRRKRQNQIEHSDPETDIDDSDFDSDFTDSSGSDDSSDEESNDESNPQGNCILIHVERKARVRKQLFHMNRFDKCTENESKSIILIDANNITTSIISKNTVVLCYIMFDVKKTLKSISNY